MRNIKKILMVALLLCLAIAVTVGLSSCKPEMKPHVHQFAQEITKDATCTEAGELTFACDCGYSYTEKIKAKGHNEVVDAAKPADCLNPGLTEGSHCAECGFVFVDQTATKPLGHKPGAPATCDSAQICENGCGLVYVAAFGHLTFAEATCTTDEVCTICEKVVTPATGHNYVALVKEATCKEGGFTNYSCKCGNYYVDDYTPISDHHYNTFVTEPTCMAKGYTEYDCVDCRHYYVGDYVDAVPHQFESDVTEPDCLNAGYTTYDCKFCDTTYVDDHVDALGHDMTGAFIDGDNGFYLECQNGCGHTEDIEVPVADSYKATIDNSFTSSRANVLDFKFVKYGAAGIYTNGSISKDTEYVGGIGGLDKGAYYVGYEFVMEKAGTIDIIWSIAGNYWKSGVGNVGLDDMAKYMVINIDGKPVDISGLELPKGDGVNANEYWNMQQFIIKDVVLDAGVHTFFCNIDPNDDSNTKTTTGGLNVGTMTIQSSKPVSIRPIPTATSTKLVLEGDRVYYVITLANCVYTIDEIEFFEGSYVFPIDSLETDENGVTTLKLDVTDRPLNSNFNPHLRFGKLGIKYLNGSNPNGDVCGGDLQFTNYECVSLNGKHYVIWNNWNMPAMQVYGKTMLNTAYDIVEENGKAVLLLSYICLDFDENTAKFYDGSKVLPYTVERKGALVVYHIDLTNTVGANFYAHMTINGQKWNGKDNKTSSDGNVLAPGWTGGTGWSTKKVITVNGQVYVLGIQYKMIVIGH